MTARPATAVFRSSTNLVQVPVVVRDSSGHAVGTLGADDFQLFDGGKPQAISRFSVEKFDSAESLQTRAKSGDANKPEQGGDAVPQVVTTALPDRFVALLIDDVNLEPVEFIAGRTAALHFIGTLRPDEPEDG